MIRTYVVILRIKINDDSLRWRLEIKGDNYGVVN